MNWLSRDRWFDFYLALGVSGLTILGGKARRKRLIPLNLSQLPRRYDPAKGLSIVAGLSVRGLPP